MDPRQTLRVSVESWKAGEGPESEGLLVVSGQGIEASWLSEDGLLWVAVGNNKFLARANRLFADDRGRVTPTLELHLYLLHENEPAANPWESLQADSTQPVYLEALTSDEIDRLASAPRWKVIFERSPLTHTQESKGPSLPHDESEDNDLSLADA